jgi:hypothetical protein
MYKKPLLRSIVLFLMLCIKITLKPLLNLIRMMLIEKSTFFYTKQIFDYNFYN